MDLHKQDVWTKEDKSLKITASEFNGEIYVHIREYFVDLDTDSEFPTKRGYAFKAHLLDDVINSLQIVSKKLTDKYLEDLK